MQPFNRCFRFLLWMAFFIGTHTVAASIPSPSALGTLPQPKSDDSVRSASDQSFKILTIQAIELPKKTVQKTIYCYNYMWNRKELERLGCSTSHLDEMGIR